MLRLHTLGGLSVTANEAPLSGAVARRRSLALLTLAAAADNGVSDEHAVALLWPDFDQTRARNNLKQVVFTLRHALGHDIFSRSSTALRLDSSLISVDRWDFAHAMAEGDPERAVALYQGPFLDGFHIHGLHEFERWVEGERERLAHAFTNALTSLATAAGATGNHPGAIAWWRRIAAEDPLNDVYAQRLIRALAASGDTAGALHHARVHESLVEQELELKPSPGFQRLVQDIRAGRPLVDDVAASTREIHTAVLAAPALSTAASSRTAGALDHLDLPNGNPSPAVRPEPVGSRPTTPDPTKYPRRRQIWTTGERRVAGFTTRLTAAALALLVIGALAAFTVVRFGPPRPTETEIGSSAAVVLPFVVNAGTDSGNLGSVVSELLAASVDGSLGLRALAVGGDRLIQVAQQGSGVPRRDVARRLATRLGAGFYVYGEVFQSGDRLRISAEFRSRHDESMLDRAMAEGTSAELFDLVDKVASQLLAGRIAGGRRDVIRVASMTTSSLPAAKAYFHAEAAMAEGRFRAALDSYEEAVQLDSTFALAHYGLASAAEMLGDDERVQRAAGQARRYAERLPGRQQRLLSAFLARQRGSVADAERLYAQLTTDYPADVEAWLGLGETLFHLNPLQGQPATEAGAAFERATVLDSTNIGGIVHLARIAALQGNEDRSRRLVARARTLAPEPALARFALHVLSLGVPLDDAARGHSPARGAVPALTAADAVALLTHDSADDLRRFARRLATGSSRGYGLRLLSLVEAGQGRIAEALALLDTCGASSHHLAIETRSHLAVLSFIPLDRLALERVRDEVRAWTDETHLDGDPTDSVRHARASRYFRIHRLGLLALRLKDTAAVESLAVQLRQMPGAGPERATGRALATSLRAHLAVARGGTLEALGLFEQVSSGRTGTPLSLDAYDRLRYAQLLEERGRYEEALGYYAQLGGRSAYELALLWQADLGMARIHEKRGEGSLAAHFYHRVAARLKDADPAFLPQRDEAARKAALLPLDRSRRLR